MGTKELLIEQVGEWVGSGEVKNVIDLGSGRSRYWLPLFERFPGLDYTGIEPNPADAEAARELLKPYPNARIVNKLAYDRPQAEYDLCISISVLEHVKDLDLFLANSIGYIKPGGRLVHMYDLGHALFSRSRKEKFQVWLGNHMGWILPEDKFVAYVDESKVKDTLEKGGIEVEKATYHQMVSHRGLAKALKNSTDPGKEALLREIFEWEFKISPLMRDVPVLSREKLFSSVIIWGKKASNNQ